MVKEYRQIGSETRTQVVMVDDLNEYGELTGTQHEETIVREVPVMGWVEREETQWERAAIAQAEAERMEYEADREPTAQERIHQLEEQNSMLLECLLEMSEIVYA